MAVAALDEARRITSAYVDRHHRAAVERVTAVIDADPAAAHTVDDLAKLANYSRFHFTRIFYGATGRAPLQYVADARLKLAMHLLLTTSLTVTAITHEVGYHSLGFFSSMFTRRVGMPASEYRRAYADTHQSRPDYGQEARQ